MKKEEKEKLFDLLSEVNKYPHHFAYVFTTSEDFRKPTIVNFSEFQDLIDLINTYSEKRKVFYKIQMRNKFIFVDVGNYS